MNDAAPLPVLLVRWFEARLHESVGFCLRGCRLYGLEVIDAAGLCEHDPLAARASFIGEGEGRDEVMALPGARAVLGFDAAALVTTEWYPTAGGRPARPGEFVARRRARVVEVVVDGVGVTALRYENDPDFIVLAPAS